MTLPNEPQENPDAAAKLAAMVEQARARQMYAQKLIARETKALGSGPRSVDAARRIVNELRECAAIIETSLRDVRALGMEEPRLALTTYTVLRRSLGTVKMAAAVPEKMLEAGEYPE